MEKIIKANFVIVFELLDKMIALLNIIGNVSSMVTPFLMQHGLQHEDHACYWRYCTARLRRLDKSLKFTRGHDKYTRSAISKSTVTEVKLLHLVFYMAERELSTMSWKKTASKWPNCMLAYFI